MRSFFQGLFPDKYWVMGSALVGAGVACLCHSAVLQERAAHVWVEAEHIIKEELPKRE